MAHPDAATTNGYTPLHISAREGQVDVASVLLEAGASHSMSTKVRQNACIPVPQHMPVSWGMHFHTEKLNMFESFILLLFNSDPEVTFMLK